LEERLLGGHLLKVKEYFKDAARAPGLSLTAVGTELYTRKHKKLLVSLSAVPAFVLVFSLAFRPIDSKKE